MSAGGQTRKEWHGQMPLVAPSVCANCQTPLTKDGRCTQCTVRGYIEGMHTKINADDRLKEAVHLEVRAPDIACLAFNSFQSFFYLL